MRTIFLGAASLFALTGVAFAQADQQAENQAEANSEQSECLQRIDGIDRAGLSSDIRSDIQTLQAAAEVFAERGDEGACGTLAGEIEDLRDENAPEEDADASAGDDAAQDEEANDEPEMSPAERARMEREAKFEAASALNESGERISVDELLGAELKNLDGDTVATVSDVMLPGAAEGNPYAVATHGGVLGLGGEKIMVPLGEIRLSEDGTYFLNVSSEQLKDAPRMESADATDAGENWTGDVDSWWDNREADMSDETEGDDER